MFLDNGLRSSVSAVAAGKGQLTALRLLLKSKIDVNAEVAAFLRFTLMEFNAALNFAGQGEANSASNGFEWGCWPPSSRDFSSWSEIRFGEYFRSFFKTHRCWPAGSFWLIALEDFERFKLYEALGLRQSFKGSIVTEVGKGTSQLLPQADFVQRLQFGLHINR